MSWFRRRKEQQDPSEAQGWPNGPDFANGDDPLLGGEPGEFDDRQASRPFTDSYDDARAQSGAGDASGSGDPSAGRNQGPWDVSEHPDLDGLVDLGGLRIPGRDGMELRLEVEEESSRVIAATIQLGDSAVQLQAFAAPRHEGIWSEIRREIAASVTRQGGTADEVGGTFGTELLARVPARAPDGSTGHQPARFAGIDGPRWFLRAVFHGAAAYQDDAAEELENLVRGVVVVRGTEAMAPRELLSLALPGGAEAGPAPDEEEPETLRPPQRGPEITEVR